MNTGKLSFTPAPFGCLLDEAVRTMKTAGFDSTELFPKDYYFSYEGPDAVLRLLRETGMEVSCYQNLRNYEGMPEEQRSTKNQIAEQLFAQMQLLGTDTLVLCTNIAGDAIGDEARIVRDLRALGDMAARHEKRVAWEAICWGKWVRDYRHAWEIVQKVDHPNIGLVLDSFHLFALDLPLDDITRIDPRKIFLVEVCDIPKGNFPDFIELSRGYRLVPGEGHCAVGDFLQAVRQTGYDGYLSVEVFNSYYRTLPAQEVADRARRSLDRFL
jgi:4-hydroxyphenylpyruvate dioxygenase